MKFNRHQTRHGERGVAIVVVLAIISIVLLLVAANLRALNDLGREVRLLDERQTHRLEKQTGGMTNPGANALQPSTNTPAPALVVTVEPK